MQQAPVLVGVTRGGVSPFQVRRLQNEHVRGPTKMTGLVLKKKSAIRLLSTSNASTEQNVGYRYKKKNHSLEGGMSAAQKVRTVSCAVVDVKTNSEPSEWLRVFPS
jgi:hypothetical protein